MRASEAGALGCQAHVGVENGSGILNECRCTQSACVDLRHLFSEGSCMRRSISIGECGTQGGKQGRGCHTGEREGAADVVRLDKGGVGRLVPRDWQDDERHALRTGHTGGEVQRGVWEQEKGLRGCRILRVSSDGISGKDSGRERTAAQASLIELAPPWQTSSRQ